MKEMIKKNTRLLLFFNCSHYWGGKLREAAKKQGIMRGLTIYTETQWYTTALMCMSVLAHQYVLIRLKRIKKLTIIVEKLSESYVSLKRLQSLQKASLVYRQMLFVSQLETWSTGTIRPSTFVFAARLLIPSGT